MVTAQSGGRVLRDIYDLNFVPTSEWIQQKGCVLLVVHLPGFTKEQVGVQLQSLDRLRVCGKSPGLAHTWFNFDEVFPIPEDCTTSSMQTIFEDGILYVMFEKKKKNNNIINQISFKRNQRLAKPSTQPSPSNNRRDELVSAASPRTASTGGGLDQERVEAPRKLESKILEEENKENNLKRVISTVQGNSQSAGAKNVDDNNNILGNNNIRTDAKNYTEAQSFEKPLISGKPEAGRGGAREDEGGENGSKNGVGGRKFFALSSIGVAAALVIVSLGAYITYSHWSSKIPKKQNQ